MLTELVRDHFLGMVFGLAIGDALGTPHEGQLGVTLRARLEGKPLEMRGDPRRRIAPGQWGDDTGQVVALLEAFNAVRDFDGPEIGGRLLDWFRTNPRGTSEHTRRVMRILDNDLDFWQDAGRSSWYESAGTEASDSALARSLVPGLYFASDIHKMVDRTIKVCHITHYDPRCLEAALALNFTLVQFLHRRLPENLNAQTVAFLEATRQTEEWRTQVLAIDEMMLQRYTNFTPDPSYGDLPDETLDAVRALGRIRYEDLKTTGRASATAALAIWCSTHAETFEQAMRLAILHGGKTDTQGAITGALAGARFGFSRIPREWPAALNDSARLMAIGEVLLSRAMIEEERDYQEGRRDPIRRPPSIM
ncbi:MAG: ADP-ribosyl-[dinitrogen reductase] hydrolase [Candidatus Sumerlaeota bacterium]|nr:ADP-ribosyl-[dinitrogen reductase] hydrolase [Candidatus Sumerlaeota bacterium]